MLAVLWIWLALFAVRPALAASDHPALSLPVAMPAATTTLASSNSQQQTYPLIVGRIVQLGGIRGNISVIRTIEGPVARRTLAVSGVRSAKVLDATIGRRLAKAGFEPLFTCQGAACGPRFQRASPGYRVAPGHFDGPIDGQTYRAMRRSGTNGDEYAAVQIAADGPRLAVQFDVVLSQPREVAAITVSAAEMARQLAQTGRVALYGIFFNSNSDRIKPEGRSTISQIAQLLSNKPKLRLLVVGHTDSRGTFAYNMALSKRRAKTVVDALVEHYGIDPSRLKPLGVSYAAPNASNTSAAGRAKNRRVELVRW